MTRVAVLVFSNSLLPQQPPADLYILVEHPAFVTRYRFNKLRLLFMRATMKKYQRALSGDTLYLDVSQFATLAQVIIQEGVTAVSYYDTTDSEVEKELAVLLPSAQRLETPSFVTTRAVLAASKPNIASQAAFYEWQRKRLNILVENGKPVGGKWSFDAANQQRLPAGTTFQYPATELDNDLREAQQYVDTHFASNPSNYDGYEYYAFDRAGALLRLEAFIRDRLPHFGDYQDFTDTREQFLYHSVLSPYINCGLLTPQEVLDAVLAAGDNVSLNNREGFVRQLIGWREYMRYLYLEREGELRVVNPFSHQRRLSSAWYDGTLGIPPVDDTISDAFATGYLHHIRRLMYVGQMMLLAEVHPDDIMRWFSEFSLDSYDWVMIGNCYGMIGFDRKMISKPYVSSSNYILKQSNYHKDGKWDELWKSLYYNFLHHNKEAIRGRASILLGNYNKLSAEKLRQHLSEAGAFIARVTTE